MASWITKVIFAVCVVLLLSGECLTLGAETDQTLVAQREKHFTLWRQERDEFFKTHQRSPLTPEGKRKFQYLHYYPFDPRYVFVGEIERYVLDHNNPKYYATFLTNKGTSKRYIRYHCCPRNPESIATSVDFIELCDWHLRLSKSGSPQSRRGR